MHSKHSFFHEKGDYIYYAVAEITNAILDKLVIGIK